MFDINGDGLVDRIVRRRSLYADGWLVQFGTGSGFSEPIQWPGGVELFDPVESTSVCGLVFPRFEENRTGLADMNADGLPDAIRVVTADGLVSATSLWWGTESAMALGVLGVTPQFALPFLPSAFATSDILDRAWDPAGSCASIVPGVQQPDTAFVDLNADGIPDYVASNNYGGFYVTVRNGIDVAQTVLLRAITIEDGALYEIAYDRATAFGLVPRLGPLPVVKSIRTSGPAMEANTLRYSYSAPVVGSPWWDPHKVEFRGFERTQRIDEVRGTAALTNWEARSHVFEGSPKRIEAYAVSYSGTVPIFVGPYSIVENEYGARSVASAVGCAAGTSVGMPSDPAAAAYPLVRFAMESRRTTVVSGEELTTLSQTSCFDVDSAGNVTKTYIDRDVSARGDEYISYRSYDPDAAICRSCVRGGREARLFPDFESGSGRDLISFINTYSATDLLAEHSSNYGGETVRGDLTRYYGNGNRSEVYSPDHYESYEYDRYQLRPVREVRASTSSLATKQLETVRTYDPYTDWLTLVRGPSVVGSTAAASTVGYAYDAFGRKIAETLGENTTSTIVRALRAFEYRDSEFPHSVRTYTFAMAQTYPRGGPIPDAPDVQQTVEYRDGFGRPVQRRERLGTAGTPLSTSSNVASILQGYRVSYANVLDGAGRERVVLEPYYSDSSSYVDLRSTSSQALAELNTVGLRGKTTSYDGQGRVSCTVERPIAGQLPPLSSSPADCVTDTTPGPSFRLATRYIYGTQVIAAGPGGIGSRRYLTTTVLRAEGITTTDYLDASGRALVSGDAYGNKTWLVLDLLGRETARVRETRDGSKSVSSTTQYDGHDRVWRRWDPNRGAETYDYGVYNLPRPVWVHRDSGSSMLFRYEDVGRLTRHEEYRQFEEQTCDGGTGECWTSVGLQHVKLHEAHAYDEGWLGVYTGGRIAASWNDTTTIAFGYSERGAVILRDQWISGAPGKFRTEIVRRDDEGVRMSVNRWSGAGLAAGRDGASYYVDYDSAARPVSLKGYWLSPSDVYWSIPQDAASRYDAMGRPRVILADNGLARTTRGYSPYTGRMISDRKQLGGQDLYYAYFDYRGSQLLSYFDAQTSTHYGFTYDDGGRLWRATAFPDDYCRDGVQHYDETYSMDVGKSLTLGVSSSLGNLERVWSGRATCAGDVLEVDQTYNYDPNAPDQLSSITAPGVEPETFEHTAGGEVSARTIGERVEERFYYDGERHLQLIQRPTDDSEKLLYGPSGELVVRQRGQELTFYAGEHATATALLPAGCAVPSATCVGTATRFDSHVLLGTTRVATVSGPDGVLYYYRDREGSVIATSLSAGRAGARYRYMPYGLVDDVASSEPAGTASELGYAGALRLSGNLLFMRTRVYHPALRRFLQPDSSDLRRYTYVGGDPVNYVDPSGMEEYPVIDVPVLDDDAVWTPPTFALRASDPASHMEPECTQCVRARSLDVGDGFGWRTRCR